MKLQTTNLTYIFMERVLQDYLCLVNAHAHMLHRHIMCILHSFLIRDVLEKTFTAIGEMSHRVYGCC